jgi:hypothetical protein
MVEMSAIQHGVSLDSFSGFCGGALKAKNTSRLVFGYLGLEVVCQIAHLEVIHSEEYTVLTLEPSMQVRKVLREPPQDCRRCYLFLLVPGVSLFSHSLHGAHSCRHGVSVTVLRDGWKILLSSLWLWASSSSQTSP